MCPSIKPMRHAILRTILIVAVIAVALIIAGRSLAAQGGIEWPTHGWRTSSTLVGVAIGQHQLRDVRQSVLPLFADRSIEHRDPGRECARYRDALAYIQLE